MLFLIHRPVASIWVSGMPPDRCFPSHEDGDDGLAPVPDARTFVAGLDATWLAPLFVDRRSAEASLYRCLFSLEPERDASLTADVRQLRRPPPS